jgi:hypothetical protein
MYRMNAFSILKENKHIKEKKNVMLNYGKKKKGAYVEDNASPTSARG